MLQNFKEKFFKANDLEKMFKKQWYHLMAELKLYNNNNNTFKINVTHIDYKKVTAIIYPEKGLNLKDLYNYIETINAYFVGTIFIDHHEDYADILIVKEVELNQPFDIGSTKPWEVQFGYNEDSKPNIISMIDNSNILITGIAGVGKTRLLYSIISSLIKNSNQGKNININVISEKSDLQLFSEYDGVHFIDKHMEVYKFLVGINEEIDNRYKLLEDNMNLDVYCMPYSSMII